MKSTAENLSPTRVKLSIEVPFDEVKPSLDAAYKKIASQIRIPGFRPGKVPARIIDQRVGRGAVMEEAVNEVVPRKYMEAIQENDVRALGQPDIEVAPLGEGDAPLSFTAEVDVRPEITVPDLDAVTLTVDDAAVADDDIEQQLQELRERFGTLKGVERAVETGDFVSIDLAATVNGEAVEAGTAKGMSYEVGSGDLVDGLDDALAGAAAGDTVTFTTKIEQGEQAGDDADVSATVNSVKVKELPEVDDDFAQLASEFDTVAELRESLRTRLASVRLLEQGAQARDRLVEHLIDTIEFPLPESAVQSEIDARRHEVVHSLNHDDALLERYLQAQGKSPEEFDTELRDGAQKSVRAQFVLDAIADKTEVQVGNDELTDYLVRQAARYQMAPQEFANQVMESGNLPALVADVRRNKALADLLEHATITDASGNAVDLSKLAPGAIDAVEDAADFDEFDDGADDTSADGPDAGSDG